MAEPLSLIGASAKIITSVFQWAWKVKESINEYQKVADKMLECQDDINDSERDLGLWLKAWRLENTGDTQTGRKIWGFNNWNIIAQKITTLHGCCRKLQALMGPWDELDEKVRQFLGDLEKEREKKSNKTAHKKITKEAPPDVRRDQELVGSLSQAEVSALKEREDLIKAIKAAVGSLGKLGLIFGGFKAIEEESTKLRTSISTLERTSLKLFFDDRFPGTSRAISNTERWTIVENASYQNMLDHARRLRASAPSLYSACCNSPSEVRDVRLTMDLLASENWEGHVTTYRMVYQPTTPDCEELRVQSIESEPSEEVQPSFDTAYTLAKNGKSNSHFVVGTEPTALQYYMLQIIPKPFTLEGQTFAEVLKKTAASKDIDKWNLFPSSERVRLSYLLAESALLLLGTSWLSALSSTNLSRIQNEVKGPYILRILESDQAHCQLLSSLKEKADRGLLDLQCWCLGILLVEVARGIKVVDLKYGDDQDILVLSDESQIDIQDILVACEAPYGAVIGHCFDPETKLSSSNVDDEKYHMMLESFYEQVYLP